MLWLKPALLVMNRRHFLLSLGAPVLAAQRRTLAPPDDPVVIVGGGLAGLRAARLLQNAGARVVVLEARASSGGRARTLRVPFDDGLYGEAGAIRIPAACQRVMQLVREHRLTLLPFASTVGVPVVNVAGRIARLPDDLKSLAGPLQLNADEIGRTPAALIQRYTADVQLTVNDANIAGDPAAWRQYDEVTWPAWLRSRGASAGAVRLMTAGGDSRQLSALYVLRQLALVRRSDQFYRIAGGMDRLPRALAATLGGVVRYNAPVIRVDRAGTAIAVQYRQPDRVVSLRASHVIFAVPSSTLGQIDIKPPLSDRKNRAIRELSYFSATRFVLQTRRRFWDARGLNGSARTDDPAEIWDAAYDQPVDTGVLGMTAGGAASERLTGMTEQQALKAGVDLMSRTFPETARDFQKGALVRWSVEPWNRGAFPAFRPGQVLAVAPEIARPEERLHFAGEHTSAWTSWMEGALESAERVVREIQN